MEGPHYIVNDRPVKAIVPFKNVHHTPVRNDRNGSEVTDTMVSPSACEDDKPLLCSGMALDLPWLLYRKFSAISVGNGLIELRPANPNILSAYAKLRCLLYLCSNQPLCQLPLRGVSVRFVRLEII